MDFFSPKSQYLYDDLVFLPQEGAVTGGTGRPPNSYALLFEDYSVLLDAPYSWVLAGMRELDDKGHPPRVLVLSHRNVAGQGDAYETLKQDYNLPILLHPDDASHPEAKRAGTEFGNPVENEVLQVAGLEVIHFPGHTEGSIMLYWPSHGGVLFAGDCAVGPGPRQNPEPPRLERSPGPTEAMTERLAEQWRAFDKPLRAVCPLHGTIYQDRDDLADIMRPLSEEPPIDPTGRS